MGVSRHPLCTTSTAGHLPDVPADAELIGRLEESFRRMTAREGDLSERFYAGLFARHAEMRAMFPSDMTAQKQKLIDSLRMVIEHLRAPQRFRARLEELGRAHVRYGVKTDHYPIVCEMLVSAMAEQSGEDCSVEAQEEWTSAIRLVSEIMLEGAKSAPA